MQELADNVSSLDILTWIANYLARKNTPYPKLFKLPWL